jgi:cytochrome c5
MPTSAWRHLLFICLACALVGCAEAEAAEECSSTAPSVCLEPELRYANVALIFERHCAICHTGVGREPWPLDRYENVADWADLVRDELVRCSMPPPGSSSPLGNRDRARILNWLRCGLAK